MLNLTFANFVNLPGSQIH